MTTVQWTGGIEFCAHFPMLGEPDRTITEISLAVGFQSLIYFNASFRSIMGVSPSVYAKRASETDN